MTDPSVKVHGELDVEIFCKVMSLILDCTVTAKKKGVGDEKQN